MSEPMRERPPLDPQEPRGDVDGPCRVRTMTLHDLDTLVALDAKQAGRHRKPYYADKLARCIGEPGINTSLLAEMDGLPVGFLLGRLFLGEFGIPSTRAVLDALGVHPAYRKQHIAHTLMEQYRKNLLALRVEAVDTLVEWDRFDLLGFFKAQNFRPSRDVDLVWDLARYPFAARPHTVHVREAMHEDLLVITAMDREVLGENRNTYFDARWKTANSEPSRHRFLIAEIQDEPVGYLVAGLYQGEFGIDVARGVIDTLGVRARYQQQGVASAMLQVLLDWVQARGAAQLETLCRWNAWELLRFFEYVGFRPTARVNLECRIG